MNAIPLRLPVYVDGRPYVLRVYAPTRPDRQPDFDRTLALAALEEVMQRGSSQPR